MRKSLLLMLALAWLVMAGACLATQRIVVAEMFTNTG